MTSKLGDRTTAYAEAALAGEVVVGPLVRLACRRHVDDLARWGTTSSATAPYYFDVEAAARAMRFIEGELVLADVTDMDGQPSPFRLQSWQAFLVGSLFGWKQTSVHASSRGVTRSEYARLVASTSHLPVRLRTLRTTRRCCAPLSSRA